MNLKELIFGGSVHTDGSGGVYRDSVQAWLPIKNIIGGVVITKDNRFVKIIKIDERRMEIMLRQMRTGTNYVWLRGDVVSYGDRRIDPRLLEALDVMLELTRVQPGFYSKDGLHEPFLLRFTGNGKGAGYLFSVAWLDAATHIATVPRMKGERIIWISEIGSFGEIDLPRHHFFAARQENGTHRFFGSNEPEKI